MPLFSVILPTWNRESSIAVAIESVLQQSCDDLELLIIDDGSNDNTQQQVEGYNDSRLNYITQTHQGVSVARNNGIEKAQGRYTCFLDSDDYWHREKLDTQHKFLTNNPQYKLVQTQEIWLRDGVRVNSGKVHRKQSGDIFQQSLERCCITPSSVAIEAELLRSFEGFDTQLLACEDYELWLRITSQHKVGLIDQLCMVRHAGHKDQLSNRYPAMDRFRIYALHKLILSQICNEAQQAQTATTLMAKAKVLRNGREKRRATDTNTIQLLNLLVDNKHQQVQLESCEAALLDERNWTINAAQDDSNG